MIIRARCIQPIGERPIDNGAVVVESGRISWVGRWRECEARGRVAVHDLGEQNLRLLMTAPDRVPYLYEELPGRRQLRPFPLPLRGG